MVSYITHPSSPRHVSFMPIPIYSRQCHDDELYVMKVFERHASHCSSCADPLRSHLSGYTLCAKGHAYAIDVAQYVYSKDGTPYSLVDRKSHQRMRLEVPATLSSIRSLLRAWEKGMNLLQPVKREKTYETSSSHKERTDRPRPARLDTKLARQPTVSHHRTGSNSSSDYEYAYNYGPGYASSPTYYSYPEGSRQSPRRVPVVYRVAPGSPSARRMSYYQD